MPKKKLLAFLISAVAASSVWSQENAVLGAAQDVQEVSVQTGQEKPVEATGGSQLTADAPTRRQAFGDDEFAEDWASAKNPDVEAKEKALQKPEPPTENILLKFIKAIGSAYASGRVIDNDDEFADPDAGMVDRKKDAAADVSPAETPKAAASDVVESQPQVPEGQPTVSQTQPEPAPSGISAQQAATVQQPEAAPGEMPNTEVSPQVGDVTGIATKTGPAQPSVEPQPEVVPVNGQEPAVAMALPQAGRTFPEVTPVAWEDKLTKDTPVSELKEKAKAGDAEAQYRLGLAYFHGRGVTKNDRQALQLWQASADQGYPKAMHFMGVAYRRGIGVRKHAEKALSWFTRAAQAGSVIDQYIVADAYYEGKVNNRRDDALALFWAEYAARYGHPGALILLAQAKLEGRGVPPNIIHAYVLADKAVSFDRDADTVLEAIKKALPDEQLKIAQGLTLEEAFKPVPLAALLVQKQPAAQDGQVDSPAANKPDTDKQTEGMGND